MRQRVWLVGLVGVIVAAGLALPAAAEVTEAQNKLLAKRAAEADAYRKLAECVNGLMINSTTYVRDFVTESDTIRADLDTFIRGVRLGKPRYYEDGTCEVEAEVTVATIITTLKELHTRHYKGNNVKALDFEQMTQRIKKDKIRVVGMGAPRPDLPPDIPGGAEGFGGPPTPPRPPIPPIWQQIPVNQRLMAKRAAELDAKRRLLERIKGLRIDSRTLVRDFVTESDTINTEAEGRLVGARIVRQYYHDDELLVEVEVEVPVEWVIQTVKMLSVRSWQGNRLKALDYEQILRKQIRKNFRATGMGTVAREFVVKVTSVTKIEVPEWPTTIRATGTGTDPQIGTPQGKLKAARAAELDAKRKLAEQVWGLTIDANTTVRDFVTERDEIRSQVLAVLVGSYVDSTRFNDDGTVEVMVAIPSAQVWSVVYKELRIELKRKTG